MNTKVVTYDMGTTLKNLITLSERFVPFMIFFPPENCTFHLAWGY